MWLIFNNEPFGKTISFSRCLIRNLSPYSEVNILTASCHTDPGAVSIFDVLRKITAVVFGCCMNFKAIRRDVYVLPPPAAPPPRVIVQFEFKNASCFLLAGASTILFSFSDMGAFGFSFELI